MKRRLYHKLYLTFLAITVLSLLVTAFLARAFHEPRIPAAHILAPIARSLVCEAPGPCRGNEAQLLETKAQELGADVVVWDVEGRLLFYAGHDPAGPFSRGASGWQHGQHGPVWITHLGDGRTLGLREREHIGPHRPLFLPLLVALAILMAIGLLPLSRSITRRLEQLAEGARRWGVGDLRHRVPVVGRDEIATLAQRFNEAAAAIEALLAQERQMLAGASHELRSPLARIRMALELLADESESHQAGRARPPRGRRHRRTRRLGRGVAAFGARTAWRASASVGGDRLAGPGARRGPSRGRPGYGRAPAARL